MPLFSSEKDKDPSRKETQEFDPALVDEEGTHPDSAQDADPIGLEQEQRDKELEEGAGHSGSWHTFKTP
jgi:hypothetical protein